MGNEQNIPWCVLTNKISEPNFYAKEGISHFSCVLKFWHLLKPLNILHRTQIHQHCKFCYLFKGNESRRSIKNKLSNKKSAIRNFTSKNLKKLISFSVLLSERKIWKKGREGEGKKTFSGWDSNLEKQINLLNGP